MTPERRFDIDWLRVIAIFLLIPFHTGRIFDDDGFYIKNAVISPFIEEFVHFFFGQWRLALLFVVSGIGTRFALGFRYPRAPGRVAFATKLRSRWRWLGEKPPSYARAWWEAHPALEPD